MLSSICLSNFRRPFYIGFVLCLFFTELLFAQRIEKNLDKLEQAFLTGDSKLITRYYNRIWKIASRRELAVQDSIRYLYAEARYNRWAGELQNSEKLAEKLLYKGKSHLGENSPFYQDFLIRRAQISYDGGEFAVCKETLDKFFGLLRKYPISDSDMVFRARLLQVRNVIEMGAFGEATALVDKLVAKAENRMKERKAVRNGDKTSYENLNERDLRRRRHEWLWARVLKARYLRERGDIKEAGEELNQLEQFCQKYNIKEEDQAHIEYGFEQCRYSFAIGQLDEAILILRKNLLWFSRRDYPFTYTKTHDQYLYGLELLIKLYLANKDLDRSRDYELAFRRIIAKRLPESPANDAKMIIPLGALFDLSDEKLATEMEDARKKLISNSLPARYSGRIFDFLVRFHIRKNNLANVEPLLKQQVDYLKLKLGESSAFYHLKRCELAQYYSSYTSNLELAEGIFKESLHENLVNQLSEKSPELLNAWNAEGLYFGLTNQFQKALNNYVQVLQTLEVLYGNPSPEVAGQLYRIADMETNLGEFAKAEQKFLSALGTLKKKRNIEYSECERLLARHYITTGRFEEADRHLARSLSYEKNKSGNMLKFNGMDDEIILMIHKGLFQEAKQKSDELIKTKVTYLKTEKHRLLVTPYQLAAQVYTALGDYSAAEEYGLKARESSRMAFGDTSLQYFRSLSILSRVHSSFGDYDRALDMANTSYEGISRNYGNQHPEAAQPLTDRAMVLLQKGGDKGKILKYLKDASAIVKNAYGKENPKYAESLQYLASFYLQSGKWIEAGPALDTADAIWKDRLGKQNVHSAEILLLRADIDAHFGRIEASRKSLEKAADLYSEIFTNLHPRYLEILPRISQTYFMEKQEAKALSFAREACRQNLIYISKFFPSMSDREKTRMWNTMKTGFEYFYTLGSTYYHDRPELLEEMYNNILKTKAILLSASIQVRERILNSDDAVLKNRYLEWISLKEKITAAIELSPEERKQDGIDLRSLESEADKLEGELTASSEEFRQASKQNAVSISAIKSKLQPNERAIEMVRFRYFDKSFTDSVIYAALIIDSDPRKKPDIVLFPNGKKMEGSYNRYYRKSVRLQLSDTLSYTFFWKPLQNYMPKTGRVFFSPDGVYNEINPEGLLKTDGKYVIEEDKIIMLASTRDLAEKSKKERKSARSKPQAIIIGNPQYYSENKESAKQKIEKLPGTGEEVEKISKELNKNRWEVHSITGSHATEDTLKSKIIKPRVLHIATHGFFFEPPKAYFLETAYSMLNRNALIDNPLLRSGLYLSDAGNVLEEIEGSKEAVHAGNGIFSSLEALNLDLSSTELVVLSACETGRGDIQVGEGVYGLHRSFQIAGSGAVIMSLFKVSDEATQQLMSVFYRKWVSENKNIRTAFTESKLELKKTFPHPAFWASFVLVGDI